MPDLEFYDQGITFTVTIRRETAVRIQVPTGTFRRIGSESSELLELLTNKKTVDELAAELGISPNAVRKRLTSLRSAGLVIQHGGRAVAVSRRSEVIRLGVSATPDVGAPSNTITL